MSDFSSSPPFFFYVSWKVSESFFFFLTFLLSFCHQPCWQPNHTDLNCLVILPCKVSLYLDSTGACRVVKSSRLMAARLFYLPKRVWRVDPLLAGRIERTRFGVRYWNQAVGLWRGKSTRRYLVPVNIPNTIHCWSVWSYQRRIHVPVFTVPMVTY